MPYKFVESNVSYQPHMADSKSNSIDKQNNFILNYSTVNIPKIALLNPF